jgi:apolipoprotein N-acyltransferase
MRITIADPASPTKNMTSRIRRPMTASWNMGVFYRVRSEDDVSFHPGSTSGEGRRAMRYTRPRMKRGTWKYWAAAVLSAGLLELPFPLAGPLPPWRSIVAWFAMVPLIWAILRVAEQNPRPLRSAFLVGYTCGVLWYAGNCYWIYDTMLIHGGLTPFVSALLLAGFSLVLGGYFGLFGLFVALLRRRLGAAWALAAAPFFWVALDLAGARITSVPWDQLGYSQVDNLFLTMLAPYAGVYGITFVLVASNALLAWGVFFPGQNRMRGAFIGIWIILCGNAGWLLSRTVANTLAVETPTATAVLIQPNLNVASPNIWNSPQDWSRHIAQFIQLSHEQCKSYIAGIPQTGAPTQQIVCPSNPPRPDLVAWPEAPAFSFVEANPVFRQTMSQIARQEQTTLIVGGIGEDYSEAQQQWLDYNSAMLFGADGQRIGRYDKIHLVPYGEYIPYRNLFFFAHKLTGQVVDFSRGVDRTVFRIPDQNGVVRRYGVFICYEAVFADEVRQFARNGAQVLVNLSDDGWYGDTSAPWQHLNMARMRAIENRRWLLRDTNNGVTAVIDPYGRVRQSIPRHQVDALPAQFAFRSDITFYTAHGDLFAWICAVLSLVVVVWAGGGPSRRQPVAKINQVG